MSEPDLTVLVLTDVIRTLNKLLETERVRVEALEAELARWRQQGEHVSQRLATILERAKTVEASGETLRVALAAPTLELSGVSALSHTLNREREQRQPPRQPAQPQTETPSAVDDEINIEAISDAAMGDAATRVVGAQHV